MKKHYMRYIFVCLLSVFMGGFIINIDKANASLGSDISAQVQQRLSGMNRVPGNLGQQIRTEVQSRLGNDVVLASSSQTYSTVKIAAQPNMLTATFTSKTPNTVLIDIEVYQGDSRVFDKSTDNVSFSAGESKTLTAMIPFVYQQATYHWVVSIYTPGRGQLLHKYDPVQSFDGAYDIHTGPTISIVQTDRPHAPVPHGQSFNVTPTLISSGGDSNNLAIVVAIDDIDADQRFQQIFYNQNLAANTPTNFTLNVASTTPAGNYQIMIDVYHDYLGNLTNSVHFTGGTVVIQ